MIDAERFRTIDGIFQAALDLPPGERSSYTSAACNGDVSLIREVELLLASDQQDWDLIATSAFELVAPLLSEAHPQYEVGACLGRYRIVSLVGVGGMGHVYLAEDDKLGRKVALKLLPKSYTRNESRLLRFEQEARAASALNHPNILTIYELGDDDSQQFIATEFVEGETLRDRLNRGPVSISETLNIAWQICGALAAAHRAGIVHRDIKPENIMVRPDGYVKVLDFGLAKLTQPDQHLIDVNSVGDINLSSGLIMGTVKYMSPEQAAGQEVDSRSDIFSLGVVLYEMLAGRTPFQGETAAELVLAIAEQEPEPMDGPDVMNQVILKALAKSKEERYQTIDAFRQGLERLGQTQSFDRGVETQSAGKVSESVPRPEAGQSFALPRLSFPTFGIAAASLILFLSSLWFFLTGFSGESAGTALSFQERDWVLIADFENRTGEPLFEQTIESALERELSNSRFVNVVTPERMADSLRLMQKPASTKVDAHLGREISLRDGNVRVLLTGGIEKIGTTYIMSVNLVDPHGDRTVVSFNEEVVGQDGVWPAVRQLSNSVRIALGESLPSIRQSSDALEKVTTPSLRALQLYSKAMQLVNDWQAGPAEQILRQALAEDPEFASAYNMLAHTLRNQGRPVDEWEPLSERALDLSSRSSDRERYFIEGSYHSTRRQYDKAVPAYEALIAQYPDHFWGRNNLGFSYFFLGRIQESTTQFIQAAELRPNDPRINRRAAWNLMLRSIDEARPFVERASHAITPELAAAHPQEVAWIQLFSVHDLWMKGDLESALAELDRWRQTIEEREGREKEVFVVAVANLYLTFGKLAAAEELIQYISSSSFDHDGFTAAVAYATGDQAKLKQVLLSHAEGAKGGDPLTALLLARAGLASVAQKELLGHSSSGPQQNLMDELMIKATKGEIARLRGKTSEAITLLQEIVPAARRNSAPVFYIASEALADAFASRGDLHRSAEVLEAASREKTVAYENGGSGQYLLRVKWKLADVYRDLGRAAEAELIDSEISNLLAFADAGHPLLLNVNSFWEQPGGINER